MMFRQRSSAVSARATWIWCAEVQMLACVRGTSFGRDVVPEVWRTKATSLGWAKTGEKQTTGRACEVHRVLAAQGEDACLGFEDGRTFEDRDATLVGHRSSGGSGPCRENEGLGMH